MHHRRSIVLMSTVLVTGTAVTGCGRVAQKDKPNGERPPATLQLSAAITDKAVTISPAKLGGGPVRIVISNQSSKSVRATLAPSGTRGETRVTRDPIAPGAIAAIQGTVTRGTWHLKAGSGIEDARLKVGKTRGSSDGDLLLP